MKKTTLKNIIPFILILFTIYEAGAQKVGSYQCKWQQEIDGISNEHLIDKMQVHEKSQFLYLISNDDENLYIHLITGDRNAVAKIMRFGLTTWLNPDAKQKKNLGMRFPVEPDGAGEASFRREKGGDRREMMLAMLATKNREMDLIGFSGKGGIIRIDPTLDPYFHGKMEMLEGGRLKISLALPLDKINRGQAETRTDPISLGFETGYLDVTGQGMPSGGMQGSGEGMHGGGGRTGGGPPPGMMPGNAQTASGEQQQRPDIGELASPSKMWIKQVKLAQQP